MSAPSPVPASGVASDGKWSPQRWETTFISVTNESLQVVIDEANRHTNTHGAEGWEVVDYLGAARSGLASLRGLRQGRRVLLRVEHRLHHEAAPATCLSPARGVAGTPALRIDLTSPGDRIPFRSAIRPASSPTPAAPKSATAIPSRMTRNGSAKRSGRGGWPGSAWPPCSAKACWVSGKVSRSDQLR